MENIWRVAKTKNLVAALLFLTWGEDSELQFNGTEWTSYYYFRQLQKGN